MECLSLKYVLISIALFNLISFNKAANLDSVSKSLTEAADADQTSETSVLTVSTETTETNVVINSTNSTEKTIKPTTVDTILIHDDKHNKNVESISAHYPVASNLSESKKVVSLVDSKPSFHKIIQEMLKDRSDKNVSSSDPIIMKTRFVAIPSAAEDLLRNMKSGHSEVIPNPTAGAGSLNKTPVFKPLTKEQLQSLKVHSEIAKENAKTKGNVSNATVTPAQSRWLWNLIGMGNKDKNIGTGGNPSSSVSLENADPNLPPGFKEVVILKPRMNPSPGEGFYECPYTEIINEQKETTTAKSSFFSF